MQGSNFAAPIMDMPWTTEEHNLFLQGYLLYGKCWIEIAEIVRTRNAYQVCSYGTWLESHGCLPRLPPIQSVAPKPITNTTATVPSYNKGVWSDEEHLLFLKGLKIYGRGSWTNISMHVKTRTSTQVLSHARTYFKRLENSNESVSGTKRKASDDEEPAKKKAKEDPTKKATPPQASKGTSGVGNVAKAKTVAASPEKAVERAVHIKKETSSKADTTDDSTLDVKPPSIKSEAVEPLRVKKIDPLVEKDVKSLGDEGISDETVAKEAVIGPCDSSSQIPFESRIPIMAIGFLVTIAGLLAGMALMMMGSETGDSFVSPDLGDNVSEL